MPSHSLSPEQFAIASRLAALVASKKAPAANQSQGAISRVLSGGMHLITFVPYIIGSVVLSYGAAGIVSAVVELPVSNVEMAFLGLQLRGGSNLMLSPLLKMDLFIPCQL